MGMVVVLGVEQLITRRLQLVLRDTRVMIIVHIMASKLRQPRMVPMVSLLLQFHILLQIHMLSNMLRQQRQLLREECHQQHQVVCILSSSADVTVFGCPYQLAFRYELVVFSSAVRILLCLNI
jgi:hypothetical protein